MVVPARITTRELLRSLEQKTGKSPAELTELLDAVCVSVREFLEQGSEVELGDLLSLAIEGGPEIREDESGGFSAFAARNKSVAARPIGSLKTSLDRACQAAIYYVSRSAGEFSELLGEHFGRRGWPLINVRNGHEVHTRVEQNPPAALVFESHVDGWQELVRELKCNPLTNRVPIVGLFPASAREDPVEGLLVMPDEIVYEPFDFSEFIGTAATELADRVSNQDNDTLELHLQLPGNRRDRKEGRAMVQEVLLRCEQNESFAEDACAAMAEALDNAMRHGHRHVECCTIDLRLILDPKRLVIVIRDTGNGFDHASVLAAARAPTRSGGLAGAAEHLRTRRGDVTEGGIARMFDLVDRLDYNRAGNQVVLTKNRPRG